MYSSAAPQSVAVCTDVTFVNNVRGLLMFTNKEPGVVVAFIGIIVPGFFIYRLLVLVSGVGSRAVNVDTPRRPVCIPSYQRFGRTYWLHLRGASLD